MTPGLSRRYVLPALGATLAVTVACQDRNSAADASVGEVTALWSAAINGGDPVGLAALYAEDARLVPPEGPALSGRGEIESYWRGDIGAARPITTLTPDAGFASGDILHVQGTYAVAAPDGAALAEGEYEQLWTRADDAWRVRHEMWRLTPALMRGPALADRLTARWTAAYNATDPGALLGLYDADAIVSTPRHGRLTGRQEIEQFWIADFDDGAPTTTLTLSDAYIAGTMAHLEGEFLVRDGGVETVGRYVQLWRATPETGGSTASSGGSRSFDSALPRSSRSGGPPIGRQRLTAVFRSASRPRHRTEDEVDGFGLRQPGAPGRTIVRARSLVAAAARSPGPWPCHRPR